MEKAIPHFGVTEKSQTWSVLTRQKMEDVSVSERLTQPLTNEHGSELWVDVPWHTALWIKDFRILGPWHADYLLCYFEVPLPHKCIIQNLRQSDDRTTWLLLQKKVHIICWPFCKLSISNHDTDISCHSLIAFAAPSRVSRKIFRGQGYTGYWHCSPSEAKKGED